jgi:hypothetical protein
MVRANTSKLITLTVGILVLLIFTLLADSLFLGRRVSGLSFPDSLLNFSTVFLGIVIEAIPFLLIGSLASGIVSEFVSSDDLASIIPKNKVLATAVGTVLGVIFPACECGVVPLARRLYQKGLPLSACVALLLGAPVLNPIVIASTYAAFGASTVLWSRIFFTFVIAFGVGCLFLFVKEEKAILKWRWLLGDGAELREAIQSGFMVEGVTINQSFGNRLERAVSAASEDFLDTARYLILGAILATGLQSFVSQQSLLALGTDRLSSSAVMIGLAYLLSVCSTVDSFLALSFVNTFSIGSIVAFLVFGPMIDIKSTIMFLGLFKRRIVLFLILILALAALAIGFIIG